MSIELADIERSLAAFEPFRWLPEEALHKLVRSIDVSYLQADQVVLELGDTIEHLYFVRSGEVEVFRRDGELYNRLAEGSVFGQMSLLMKRKVRYPARTLTDSLFYLIPASVFDEYCDQYSEFGDFFETNNSTTLEQATQVSSDDMTTVSVRELLSGETLIVAPELSVADCATLMTEAYTSAALVRDASNNLLGIVTDSDLRERVISRRLSFDTPVHDVMTHDPTVMDDHAYLHEVMLTMLRNNVHHVPIMEGQNVLGIVSLPDMVSHESHNSLLLVRSIMSADSIDALAQLSEQLPAVYTRLVNEHATSHMIGSAMSVIGSSFMQQMAKLAEDEYGPPPVPYCLIALGSLARNEQLLVTDQDNALILSDDYDEASHKSYFDKFSKFVCAGLDRCGYPFCDGGIMASNQKWRLTQTQWREQFTSWIEKPDPQALLNVCIFFDLVAVYGQESWVSELQELIANKAKTNKPFLAALARNTLKRTPPLGFFKDFVLEEDGRHRNSFNIKRRGTAPMSDVIRVHALATGSVSQNSFERLDDIAKTTLLPEGKCDEINNALELLYTERARQQMLSIREGEEPDNQIDPELLTASGQRALKEAFSILSQAQRFLKYRYTASQ
jgi:CBS domain-containing protein